MSFAVRLELFGCGVRLLALCGSCARKIWPGLAWRNCQDFVVPEAFMHDSIDEVGRPRARDTDICTFLQP